jgi:hypothetical protein
VTFFLLILEDMKRLHEGSVSAPVLAMESQSVIDKRLGPDRLGWMVACAFSGVLEVPEFREAGVARPILISRDAISS